MSFDQQFKTSIIEKVLEKIDLDLQKQGDVYKDTHTSFMEAPGAMESRYDTSKEELDHMMEHLERARTKKLADLSYFKKLLLISKNHNTSVKLGNMVITKDQNGLKHYYFVVENGGGISIKYDNIEVLLISVDTPLGDELLNKSVEMEIKLPDPDQEQGLRKEAITQII